MRQFTMQGWQIQCMSSSDTFRLVIAREDGAIVEETGEDILGGRGDNVLAYELTAANVVEQDQVFEPLFFSLEQVSVELQVTASGNLHVFCQAVNGFEIEHNDLTNGTDHSPTCDIECDVTTKDTSMFSIESKDMTLTGYYDGDSDQMYMTVVSQSPRDADLLSVLLSLGQSRAMQHGYMGVQESKSFFWYRGVSTPLYADDVKRPVFKVRWDIQWLAVSAEHAVAEICQRLFKEQIHAEQSIFVVKLNAQAPYQHVIDSRCVSHVDLGAATRELAQTEYYVSWETFVVANSSEAAVKSVADKVLKGGHDACAFYVSTHGGKEILIDLLSYPEEK